MSHEFQAIGEVFYLEKCGKKVNTENLLQMTSFYSQMLESFTKDKPLWIYPRYVINSKGLRR